MREPEDTEVSLQCSGVTGTEELIGELLQTPSVHLSRILSSPVVLMRPTPRLLFT